MVVLTLMFLVVFLSIRFNDTFVGTGISNVLLSTNDMQPLVGLIQGVDSHQRIGRKITVRSLLVNGTVELQPGATNADFTDNAYIYVVLDRQANGAYALNTDIWSNTVPAASLRNLDNNKRFKILKCVKIPLQSTDAAAYTRRDFELYIKMNIPIIYSANTGAIAEIKQNNIMVFVGGKTAQLTYTGAIRTRYTDN